MVKFDVFVDETEQIAINLIDDAEWTPGVSGQYT